MTDNVVDLHVREERRRVFVCDCGCSSFALIEGGSAECQVCAESFDHGGAWGDYDAPSHTGPEPYVDITGNNSVEFARRRMATLAQSEDTELLIVARSCGTVHAWSTAMTEDQLNWVNERAQEGVAVLRRNHNDSNQETPTDE